MPHKDYTIMKVKANKLAQAERWNREERKTANEERKERLRRILESRKAKSANDQEKVQSAATKDNINDVSNDAKKAK